ncbi:hypothetical protein C0992_006769 [Termitomyces sp. T32_za158]|nr:hypothetical protein C0992_006769 [Termitomyces sp. T32_za158]
MAKLLHPSDPTTFGVSQLGKVVISVVKSYSCYSPPGGRNYDYTKVYSPDKPGEEAKVNARVWNVYLDEAENYDVDMIKGFRSIIDGLLVFAALFSAVVTTFVAQTSQALQPDNSQIMVSLLIETNQLLRAAGNKTSINAIPAASLDPESRTYNVIDVWVNGLFFTSLALSLSTALLSVLANQWIQAYTTIVPGGAKTRAVTRHFRFEGLVKWKFSDVIESLPLILHCSVAVFLVGLSLYISQLSRPICGVVAGITAFTFLFYFGSSIIPAFDVACPYRIPFMFPLVQLLFFLLDLVIYAYSCLWYAITQEPHLPWRPQIQRKSLKMAEEMQVLSNCDPASHLHHNSLGWVFKYSFNHSFTEIVMEGTCGLLDELCSDPRMRYPRPLEYFLSSSEDNLFVFTIIYALSRLPDVCSTSSKEEEIGENTVYGQLIAAFMKFPFEKTRIDEPTTHSKDGKQKIIDALLEAYTEALRKKNHAISRYLLKWGGKLFQLESGWSKFSCRCAMYGDAQDLRHVADQGIDLSFHGSDGCTALHWAASHGNLDCVIALVEQKPALMSALADYMNVSAWATLDFAAMSSRRSGVVVYLLDHGAKSISHNALYYGVQGHLFPYMQLDKIEHLLDSGWDRTVRDADGKTLLDVARSKGNIMLVNHLEHYQTVRLPPYGTTPHTVDEEAS